MGWKEVEKHHPLLKVKLAPDSAAWTTPFPCSSPPRLEWMCWDKSSEYWGQGLPARVALALTHWLPSYSTFLQPSADSTTLLLLRDQTRSQPSSSTYSTRLKLITTLQKRDEIFNQAQVLEKLKSNSKQQQILFVNEFQTKRGQNGDLSKVHFFVLCVSETQTQWDSPVYLWGKLNSEGNLNIKFSSGSNLTPL